MTSSRRLQLPSPLKFRSQIETTAVARKHEVFSPLRFLGQLSLLSPADRPEEVLVPTQEFEIRSDLVSPGTETTGKISVHRLLASGNLERISAGWSFQGQVSASVFYRAIQRAVGFSIADVDLYFAPAETFDGFLTMQMTEAPGEGSLMGLRVSSGHLELHLREASRILGLLDELKINLAGQFFRAVLPVEKESGLRRRIRLRPVRFRESEGDTEPSGTTWIDLFNKAKEVWGGCCIDLVKEEVRTPVVGQIKFSESSVRIAAEFKDDEPDIVEILFTAGKLANGGGSTFQAGWGTDIVVISDVVARQNEALLAHELGHVFRGEHPNVTKVKAGYWTGGNGTVLVDTSQTGGKNPTCNSKDNCLQACNPVLVETEDPCWIAPNC